MPNIAKLLKDEIQRLARREISQAVNPLKKTNSQLRKTVAGLKQKIAALEKESHTLAGRQNKIMARAHTGAAEQAGDDFCITGKQIRSLRSRLGISQVQLAQLVGVSGNIVPIWEKKAGRLHIRKAAVKNAIADLKSMKKAAVADRIGPVQKTARRGRSKKAAPGKRAKKA